MATAMRILQRGAYPLDACALPLAHPGGVNMPRRTLGSCFHGETFLQVDIASRIDIDDRHVP